VSAVHEAAALNRGPRKHLNPRCEAFTNAGTRCTNSGSPFCYQHDHSGRPVSVRLEDQPGPSHINVARALKAQGCEIIACAAGWPDLLVKPGSNHREAENAPIPLTPAPQSRLIWTAVNFGNAQIHFLLLSARSRACRLNIA